MLNLHTYLDNTTTTTANKTGSWGTTQGSKPCFSLLRSEMFIENLIKMGIYDPDGVEQIRINEFYKYTIPSGLPRFWTAMVDTNKGIDKKQHKTASKFISFRKVKQTQ